MNSVLNDDEIVLFSEDGDENEANANLNNELLNLGIRESEMKQGRAALISAMEDRVAAGGRDEEIRYLRQRAAGNKESDAFLEVLKSLRAQKLNSLKQLQNEPNVNFVWGDRLDALEAMEDVASLATEMEDREEERERQRKEDRLEEYRLEEERREKASAAAVAKAKAKAEEGFTKEQKKALGESEETAKFLYGDDYILAKRQRETTQSNFGRQLNKQPPRYAVSRNRGFGLGGKRRRKRTKKRKRKSKKRTKKRKRKSKKRRKTKRKRNNKRKKRKTRKRR